MTLKEFRELTRDLPEDTVIDKHNTNYGWTELREVKYGEVNGKKVISLY